MPDPKHHPNAPTDAELLGQDEPSDHHPSNPVGPQPARPDEFWPPQDTCPPFIPFIRHLTPRQIRALTHLAAGCTDAATARRIGVSPRTVGRWRSFDPLFASRLNRLRANLMANTLDHIRALLPKSVQILAKDLDSPNASHQRKSAVALLRIAGTSRLVAATGPDTLHDVLLDRAMEQRERTEPPAFHRVSSPPDEGQLHELHRSLISHINSEELLESIAGEAPAHSQNRASSRFGPGDGLIPSIAIPAADLSSLHSPFTEIVNLEIAEPPSHPPATNP